MVIAVRLSEAVIYRYSETICERSAARDASFPCRQSFASSLFSQFEEPSTVNLFSPTIPRQEKWIEDEPS